MTEVFAGRNLIMSRDFALWLRDANEYTSNRPIATEVQAARRRKRTGALENAGGTLSGSALTSKD